MADTPHILLLLDSGAFTCWKSGGEIALDSYIAFIRRNRPFLAHYINLDVIPGRYRAARTAEEVKVAAKRSYDNLQKMKDAGLHPMPVFHRGEPLQWLERMLKDGETYIALAPMADSPTNVKRIWLDQCFQIILAKVRTHGLAVTALPLLQRYPFTSVDSTSWVFQSAFGQILVPRYFSGRPDYSLPAEVISITDPSPRSHHVDTLSAIKLDRVHQFLNEEVGTELAHLRYNGAQRKRALAVYFQNMAATVSSANVFFVSDDSRLLREGLSLANAQHHLLSFFKFRMKPDMTLENYLNGVLPSQRRPKTNWYRDDYISYRADALYRRSQAYRERG
jgi:hypothetical protein